MPLEGFQLFCDRNDHFPSVYDRGQSCICREPIHPATEKKKTSYKTVDRECLLLQ